MMALLLLVILSACEKKPPQMKEIDLVWSAPEQQEAGLSYKLYYRTDGMEFSETSVVVTQDTLVTLMFAIKEPTLLYFKVVAVDTAGNQGLPVFEKVEL